MLSPAHYEKKSHIRAKRPCPAGSQDPRINNRVRQVVPCGEQGLDDMDRKGRAGEDVTIDLDFHRTGRRQESKAFRRVLRMHVDRLVFLKPLVCAFVSASLNRQGVLLIHARTGSWRGEQTESCECNLDQTSDFARLWDVLEEYGVFGCSVADSDPQDGSYYNAVVLDGVGLLHSYILVLSQGCKWDIVLWIVDVLLHLISVCGAKAIW